MKTNTQKASILNIDCATLYPSLFPHDFIRELEIKRIQERDDIIDNIIEDND